MTYVALLYSPKLDYFETDCTNTIYCPADMAEWVSEIPDHHNRYCNVDDFHIVSITKIGE